MSEPLRIIHGPFGRVALLLLDKSMVLHAHRVSHVIFKEGGPDIQFGIRNREHVLSDKTCCWSMHGSRISTNITRNRSRRCCLRFIWNLIG